MDSLKPRTLKSCHLLCTMVIAIGTQELDKVAFPSCSMGARKATDGSFKYSVDHLGFPGRRYRKLLRGRSPTEAPQLDCGTPNKIRKYLC